MLIDLTDFDCFNIIFKAEFFDKEKESTLNIFDGRLGLLIDSNPLKVDYYNHPNSHIRSYRYLSFTIPPKYKIDTIINYDLINEFLSNFEFDKIKIYQRDTYDFTKRGEDRIYKAELDIDEEMLLYLKMKFEYIF